VLYKGVLKHYVAVEMVDAKEQCVCVKFCVKLGKRALETYAVLKIARGAVKFCVKLGKRALETHAALQIARGAEMLSCATKF
jgi:hypothetical protein